MSHVDSDQQFGVSAAADPDTQVMLKDGWLPNPTLWVINSIGEVVHNGQRLLVAVMSDDNTSEGSGIWIVDSVASKAADAIAGAEG